MISKSFSRTPSADRRAAACRHARVFELQLVGAWRRRERRDAMGRQHRPGRLRRRPGRLLTHAAAATESAAVRPDVCL